MNLKLHATLTARPTISAALSSKSSLTATLSIKRDIAAVKDIYKGPYSVEASASDDQILATAAKTLRDDITVKKILYLETSNDFGGCTATIA